MTASEKEIIRGHLTVLGGIVSELHDLTTANNVMQSHVILSKDAMNERVKSMQLSLWAIEDIVTHSDECECPEEPPCW